MKSKIWNEICKRDDEELTFWFSPRGLELQYCMICQGYENNIGTKLMLLFGSGLGAVQYIERVKKTLGVKI